MASISINVVLCIGTNENDNEESADVPVLMDQF